MNVLKKIKTFFKKEEHEGELNGEPQYIKVFDELGREIFITKDEWRNKVLANQLKEDWNKPDKLYDDIINALEDGFEADVLDASERLAEIDNDRERSTALRGFVLMKVGRLDKAEKLLNDYVSKYGESSVVFANLAKICAARGNEAQCEGILRRALDIDPNQGNALEWFIQIENEKEGKAAGIKMLEHYASLPKSWKPQLWLGRYALENKDIETAKEYYQYVLENFNSPYVLMMISGDLGKNGYLDEIMEMISPYYVPSLHGPACGFNLLETYLRKKEKIKGLELLHQMRLQNWVPYNGRLLEYSKALEEIPALQNEHDDVSLDANSGKIGAIVLDKPVWLYGLHNPQWLFRNKSDDAVKVVIFPLSKTINTGETTLIRNQEDDTGRLSRGIPLFIAERLYFGSNCKPKALIFTFADKGPALLSKELDWGFLDGQINFSADVYVTGEIDQMQNKYILKLHLWEVAGKRKIATVSEQAETDQLSQVLNLLLNNLEVELLKNFNVRCEKVESYYELLSSNIVLNYVYGLAQSLTLSLIENNIGCKEDLLGERNIYEWFNNLINATNGNVVAKIMFASGLLKGLGLGSEVPKEFEVRLHALLRQETVDSEFALLAPCILKKFGKHDELRTKLATYMHIERPGYKEWLQMLVKE